MNHENTFAFKMREARQAAGLSQAELARRTGISPTTIASYESTEKSKNPPIDKAAAIARELNVSLDMLCGIDNKNEQNKSDIPFESVIEALVLLLSIKGVKFCEYKESESVDEFLDIFGPLSRIDIRSGILNEFLKEYFKVGDFVNNSDYPEYLKEGLRKAVIEKFGKYVVRDNLIQTTDGCTTDCFTDDVPF